MTPTPSNRRVYTIDDKAGWDDMDLGSGGPILIEDLGFIVGAGTDGILYVVKRGAMGKTQPADLVAPAGNYARLAAPPIWFTFYPGPQVSATPADISTLNQHFFQRTHHQHAAPIYWVVTHFEISVSREARSSASEIVKFSPVSAFLTRRAFTAISGLDFCGGIIATKADTSWWGVGEIGEIGRRGRKPFGWHKGTEDHPSADGQYVVDFLCST
jgi:hypothetical protein